MGFINSDVNSLHIIGTVESELETIEVSMKISIKIFLGKRDCACKNLCRF